MVSLINKNIDISDLTNLTATSPITLTDDAVGIDQTLINHSHANHSLLLADDHTQYALLLGRSGGQTLIGGTASGDDLTLKTTSHATKGTIFFGLSSAYDDANIRIGIGTTSPTRSLHISKDFAVDDGIELLDSAGGFFRAQQTTETAGAFQPAFTGYATGDVSSLVFKGLRSTGGTTYPVISFIVRNSTDSTAIAVTDTAFRFANHTTIGALMLGSGNWGFGGVTTPTAKIHLGAGTAAASTAPLKFNSGTNLTTPEAGAVEYNGTNLFFTRSGTTRENIICSSAVNVTSPTAPNRTITINLDGSTYYLHAKTTND